MLCLHICRDEFTPSDTVNHICVRVLYSLAVAYMSTVQAHIQRRLHDSGQYCLTQHDAHPALEYDKCCRSVADGSG